MSINTVCEIIGQLGSFVVMLSFVMTSTVKLRIVNCIGSALCAVYSIIIRAYPLFICNFFIVAVNIYQLFKLLNNKNQNYTTVSCSTDNSVVKAFVTKHAADIAKYHPSFSLDNKDLNYARFIFSNDEIVGLQIGTVKDKELFLSIDYSIPSYRDCSVGRYAYAYLSGAGFKKACFNEANEHVAGYLKKLGFVKQDTKYVLTLS